MRFIDVDLMREHMGDTMVNLPRMRSGELVWTDAEIVSAMEQAARAFNSIPPFSCRANPERMSADTEVFLDASAAVLLERRVRMLDAQATEFTGGGISTDPDKPIRESMRAEAARLRAKFTAEARAFKAERNLRACYGQIG